MAINKLIQGIHPEICSVRGSSGLRWPRDCISSVDQCPSFAQQILEFLFKVISSDLKNWFEFHWYSFVISSSRPPGFFFHECDDLIWFDLIWSDLHKTWRAKVLQSPLNLLLEIVLHRSTILQLRLGGLTPPCQAQECWLSIQKSTTEELQVFKLVFNFSNFQCRLEAPLNNTVKSCFCVSSREEL